MTRGELLAAWGHLDWTRGPGLAGAGPVACGVSPEDRGGLRVEVTPDGPWWRVRVIDMKGEVLVETIGDLGDAITMARSRLRRLAARCDRIAGTPPRGD